MTTITVNTSQAAADIAVNSRTNRLYISNTSQDRIEVLDATTNTVLTPIAIGPGPVGMAIDETTNTLYVAQTDRSNVPPVAALGSVTDDGNTQQTHTAVNLGPALTQPIDVTVDALNDRIYTGNLGGGGVSPSVSVLKRGNNVLIATVNVPGPVRSVAVNPYAHQLFAAGEGGVFVVGEQTRSVMRTIPAGLAFSVATPSGLDRTLYVGDLRSGELTRLSYSSGSRQ